MILFHLQQQNIFSKLHIMLINKKFFFNDIWRNVVGYQIY